MELDSDHIRSLIARWKVSSSPEDFQSIRELLDSYVYFFPRIAYRTPESFCADFYLFVEPQLAAILRSYPLESPYRFTSWLNQVLVFKYADFSKKSPFDLPAHALPLEEASPSFLCESDSLQEENTLLSAGEKAFMLFCENPLELTAAGLTMLAEFCGCPLPQVLEAYGRICAFHDLRYERFAKETERLNHIEESLIRVNRRIQRSDPEKQTELRIKATRLENRRRHILNRMGAADKQVWRIVSKIIGSAEKARRILGRIRQKIRYLNLKQEPHAPL